MKGITHLSVSQMDTFEEQIGGCNRKWYYQKVLGLLVPQHPSAALGEQLHGILEKYLRGPAHPDGAPADVLSTSPSTRVVGARFKGLVGKCEVETSFDVPLLRTGLRLVGRIDVVDPTDLPRGTLRVIDHKSTGNVKYAKTEDELAQNIQMLGYGKVVADAHPRVPRYALAHHVIATKPPYVSLYTEAVVDYAHLEHGWQDIEDIAVRMKQVGVISSVKDVAPNWSACDKYGGCYFRDRCAAMKRMQNPQPPAPEEPEMPLSPELAALLGMPAATSAKPAAPAGAVGVTPPDAPPATKEERKEAETMHTEADPYDVALALGWDDESEIQQFTDEVYDDVVKNRRKRADWHPERLGKDIVALVKKDAVPVVPVERPRRGRAPVVETPAAPPSYETQALAAGWSPKQIVQMSACPESLDRIVEEKLDPKEWSVLPDGKLVNLKGTERAPQASLVGPVAPLPDMAPKRRGRPPGAKNKPKDEDVPQPPLVAPRVVEAPAAVTPEQDVKEPPPPAVVSEAPVGLILYIDCQPEKGGRPVAFLDDIVRPYMADIAANYRDEKSGDKRPLTHYALVPFARGPGLVASFLVANPPTGRVVVDTRLPCSAACLEVLRPMADTIISRRG